MTTAQGLENNAALEEMAAALNGEIMSEDDQNDEVQEEIVAADGLTEEESDILQELVLEEADDAEIVSADAEVDPDDLHKMDAAIERGELYKEQQSVEIETTDTKAAKEAKPKPRKAATPRVERDLEALDGSIFVIDGTIADAAKLSDSKKAEAKKDTIALKPSQVKVAEKFENLFQAIAANKMPSRYTTIAFELLNKNKTVTSADLNASFCANGCADGTARSQTGQLMNLFNAVRIADRTGQTLTLRTESLLAERLRTIAGL